LGAAAQLDGLSWQPDKTVTEEQFSAVEGLARVINNKIVLGKTDEEKAEEEKQKKINAYKADMAAIDREAGAGRAVRGLALKAAEKNAITGDDYDRLAGMEEKAEAIRENLASLLNG
jgi:predicted chitinase